MFLGSKFQYNNISGDDMFGLKLIRTESSLDQPFGIARKSITDQAKNRYRVYHYGFDSEVLSFNLKLFKEGVWTYDQRVVISKWLIQNTYKDFQSTDYPLVFKLVAVSQPQFHNLGNNQGILEITMESDAPFGYSPVFVGEYDLTDNTENGTILTLENRSNVLDIYKPELEFKMTGSTSVKLENLSNQGDTFELTNLQIGETIYINNQTGLIKSDTSETRLNNLKNHKFFKMVPGVNRVRATGKVLMEYRMQFPMMV